MPSRRRIRRTGRVAEAGMRCYLRAAIVRRIVAFERHGFIETHLQKIVPLGARVELDRERLAPPRRINRIAGDEVARSPGQSPAGQFLNL